MKHLAPADVVDVLDGCAQEPLVRHADSCGACRAIVDDARHATGLAATDAIPEPSPLFWTQFSARVGESVRRAPEPGFERWWAGLARWGGGLVRGWDRPTRWWVGLDWTWRAVPVGSVIVLVALIGLTEWQHRHPPQSQATDAAPVSLAGQVDLWSALPIDDEPWALVSQVMADVEADEMSVSDMPATIGSADRAIESLSETEQVELTRLLKAEMGEPGVRP